MDYSSFHGFPFPSTLSQEGETVKNYFMSLSDDEQLRLLNGSSSYEIFYNRILNQMVKAH